VRTALLEGLIQEARIGVNPFRYGFVAGTDSHIAAAGGAEEYGYPGHGGAGAPAGSSVPKGLPDDLEFNPGGLAVLWAEENSRESLWAALRRRETYGTSGPRMGVRLFGGFGLSDDLCGSKDFVREGYAKGVPMGSILPPAPPGVQEPRFAVWAQRDPGTPGHPGAPLQRIQIVKGWLDEGRVRESVYDVAGTPRNGADVDLSDCTPRGAGADQLCTVWHDADFEPGPAFYYARVVENPTCRWSARICVANHVDCKDLSKVPDELAACCREDHHWTVQERAWTSPIWSSIEAGS